MGEAHEIYVEYKGRIWTVAINIAPEDLQYAHAVFYPCVDILTGEVNSVKGHALRPLSDMEVLALACREDE
jgi:hypothetical protein